MNLWQWLDERWSLAIVLFALALALYASGHAVLYKRDSRAAIAWTGFIWLIPMLGAILYFGFGINRIRRKAAFMRGKLARYQAHADDSQYLSAELTSHLADRNQHLYMLARVVDRVVGRRLLPGNSVEPLVNGDEAFPAMLEAINQAQRTVCFSTYIFDRDDVGKAFAHALGDAKRRGVEVCVLVDAAGMMYSWPSIRGVLDKEGVRYATFLPTFNFKHLMSTNLRTHRKILVADGSVGFTGGINIRAGHCLQRNPAYPVQDLHFRLEGPVVTQLQEAFADDWLFATGETLRGPAWFPKLHRVGEVLARGVPDGPDEDFEKLSWTILGALSIARSTVRILTPYFLPDPALIAALNLAAMRGVEVDIILPSKSNLPYVQWASQAMWWQVLEHGCRLWLSPPPFDHSKLMVVDGCWVNFGSANWDTRSLRLNFEYNVECYDAQLAEKLEALVQSKREHAHRVTLEQVDSRTIPLRLRDGAARLFTPYL